VCFPFDQFNASLLKKIKNISFKKQKKSYDPSLYTANKIHSLLGMYAMYTHNTITKPYYNLTGVSVT